MATKREHKDTQNTGFWVSLCSRFAPAVTAGREVGEVDAVDSDMESTKTQGDGQKRGRRVAELEERLETFVGFVGQG